MIKVKMYEVQVKIEDEWCTVGFFPLHSDALECSYHKINFYREETRIVVKYINLEV